MNKTEIQRAVQRCMALFVYKNKRGGSEHEFWRSTGSLKGREEIEKGRVEWKRDVCSLSKKAILRGFHAISRQRKHGK